MVLWGIWHWRYKKVWDDKVVTTAFAMDGSFQILAQWTQARKHPDPVEHEKSSTPGVVSKANERWKPPPLAGFKINQLSFQVPKFSPQVWC